jgi:hypothetical protein
MMDTRQHSPYLSALFSAVSPERPQSSLRFNQSRLVQAGSGAGMSGKE